MSRPAAYVDRQYVNKPKTIPQIIDSKSYVS